MKVLKKIISITITLFLVLALLPHASVTVNADEGSAYAVETNAGDFIFFRSNNTYENRSEGTAVDIKGNTYSGTIYTVDENTGWTGGGFSGPGTHSPFQGYGQDTDSVKSISVAKGQTIHPKNMVMWFDYYTNVETIDLSNIDTSAVEGMPGTFRSCSSLKSLDLSTFNTSNVWDMGNMFFSDTSLQELDLSSFDTSKVTYMQAMFWRCSSLTNLDLSSFDTSNVTNMADMFRECESLVYLNLSNFNTANATDMIRMFADCTNLTELDLSKFNTKKLENNEYAMWEMFANTNLKLIKLGKDFTVWNSEAYLPEGQWTNEKVGITLSEKELYEQYPSHAAEWAGTWIKDGYEPIDTGDIYRISGSGRFQTSMKIADAYKEEKGIEQFETVILTSGLNFADALAGSYLSYKKDAPILITADAFGDSKPYEEVNGYIKANVKKGGTVYVLGGTGAVSDTALTGLEGYNVVRLKGSGRFETNIEILKEAGVKDEEILVATGYNFADSLSASAVNRPILLVGDELNNDQLAYLDTLNTKQFYILGGTGAVKGAVETQLKARGAEVKRLSGKGRHETSVLIAETFCNEADRAVLAYSFNFPDGLCAGPLASAIHGPLILTTTGEEGAAQNFCKARDITDGYVTGGTGLISDKAVRTIFGARPDTEIIKK